jgi:hypothetical protein
MNERKIELLIELLKSMNELQELRKKKKGASAPNPSANDFHATSSNLHT